MPSRGVPCATAVVPKREAQITAALGHLHNRLDELDKFISEHAERLQPILRQTEANKDECAPPEEILCPVADNIRSASKKVLRFTAIISGLTERAEV